MIGGHCKARILRRGVQRVSWCFLLKSWWDVPGMNSDLVCDFCFSGWEFPRIVVLIQRGSNKVMSMFAAGCVVGRWLGVSTVRGLWLRARPSGHPKAAGKATESCSNLFLPSDFFLATQIFKSTSRFMLFLEAVGRESISLPFPDLRWHHNSLAFALHPPSKASNGRLNYSQVSSLWVSVAGESSLLSSTCDEIGRPVPPSQVDLTLGHICKVLFAM